MTMGANMESSELPIPQALKYRPSSSLRLFSLSGLLQHGGPELSWVQSEPIVEPGLYSMSLPALRGIPVGCDISKSQLGEQRGMYILCLAFRLACLAAFTYKNGSTDCSIFIAILKKLQLNRQLPLRRLICF